ncbi:MAG: hypothetical protein ACWGNV_07470 [Bacteroidales bacterium]
MSMKPGNRHRFFLAVLAVFLMVTGIQAQSGYDSAYTEIAETLPENLVIFTDRTMYAVNEEVRFAAILQSDGNPYRGPGSTVMYAELLNQEGSAVVKSKVPIAGDHAAGHLAIPSNLNPGIYYLRGYTRWMRNFGSRTYAYVPVRIVNPFSTTPGEKASGPDENGNPLRSKGVKAIDVILTGHSHGTRDSLEVQISVNRRIKGSVRHVCVTVVPEGAVDTALFAATAEPDPGQETPFQFNFLPELNGTTISGLAKTPNGTPASGIGIHFSLFGQDPGYFVAETDLEGRFQVKTPKRYGIQEMLMVPEHIPGNRIEVQIDNDFATDPLPFHPVTFHLDKKELDLASRISLNMQLERAYLKDPEVDTSLLTGQTGTYPFYGVPGTSIKIDEFVNLPNMEEIIENLIPKMYVVRRGGGDALLLKGENPMLYLFPPLILVDHVPVFDMEVFLSIPPSRIDHIDVLRDVYIMGDMKYGGIISITTISKDLAGMQLPEGSYFFDDLGYQSPFSKRRATGPGSIPDTRNTLLWEDQLDLKEDVPSKVHVQASSTPGKYFILVRGVLTDGTLVYGSARFEVK